MVAFGAPVKHSFGFHEVRISRGKWNDGIVEFWNNGNQKPAPNTRDAFNLKRRSLPPASPERVQARDGGQAFYKIVKRFYLTTSER